MKQSVKAGKVKAEGCSEQHWLLFVDPEFLLDWSHWTESVGGR